MRKLIFLLTLFFASFVADAQQTFKFKATKMTAFEYCTEHTQYEQRGITDGAMIFTVTAAYTYIGDMKFQNISKPQITKVDGGGERLMWSIKDVEDGEECVFAIEADANENVIAIAFADSSGGMLVFSNITVISNRTPYDRDGK